MKVKFLLTFLVILNAAAWRAQTGLTQEQFQKEITNQWWSCENQINSKECDMLLLILRKDEVEFNCVNWANGFSGCKGGYQVKIQSGYFEVALKSCAGTSKYAFIYGRLEAGKTLYLLMRKAALPLGPALASEKDWLKFERIER